MKKSEKIPHKVHQPMKPGEIQRKQVSGGRSAAPVTVNASKKGKKAPTDKSSKS